MGPDEQLLLTSVEKGPETALMLSEALRDIPHSVVDVSHRQVAFQLQGAQASTALNVGCPLDLHLRAFPVGMCTRTLLGKASIVLWRTDTETFHIEAWRSFADYVSRFLAAAAREFTW
jgi:sarcosine oxidase subunit gamma